MMNRLFALVVVGCVGVAAMRVDTVVAAPDAPKKATPAEIAAKLNEEGKEFIYAGKFAEASGKFRDAIVLAPEAKYMFNLCTSLYQEGKFSESLASCKNALGHAPTPELTTKIKKLMEKIVAEAKSQNIKLKD